MRVEAHAIGGYTNGYTVLDMPEAYNMFPNGGIYQDSYAITRIVFQTGEEIVHETVKTEVLKNSTAFMITDMLIDVVDSFGYQGFSFPNMLIAGKSGQSNYSAAVINSKNIPTSAVKDLWFIGYSNQYTIGVWSGGKTFDNYIESKDIRMSRHIFRDIMLNINSTNSTILLKPNNVTSVNVEVNNEDILLPSDNTPVKYIKNEYFIRGTEPTEISEKFFTLEAPESIELKYEINDDLLTINWLEALPYNEELGEIRYEICLVKNGEKTVIGNTTNLTVDFKIGVFSLLFYDEIIIKTMYSETREFESEYQSVSISIQELL